MTEAIVQLKNIKDELEKVSFSSSTDNYEKEIDVCDIKEHIELAEYHLCFAINKLIVLQCFEKK
jgi:hypothetical protein